MTIKDHLEKSQQAIDKARADRVINSVAEIQIVESLEHLIKAVAMLAAPKSRERNT